MRTLVVDTPEGVALTHELAGPGSRAAAALLDLGIVLLVLLASLLGIALIAQSDPTGLAGVVYMAVAAGWVLFAMVYQAVLPYFWNGQTPGKAAFGLVITSDQGQPPTLLQLVLRSTFWFVEILPVPVPLGLIVIAASTHHQRIGDVVGGTVVLRRPQRVAVFEPYPRETWSGLTHRTLALSPALSARLDTADFEFLRSLLVRQGLESPRRRELFVRAARHFSDVLGFGAFDDARVVCKEIYLYLREQRTGRVTPPSRSAEAVPESAP